MENNEMELAIVCTADEISEEFKEYVKVELHRFNQDVLVGEFKFKFPFKVEQRKWVHKFVKKEYQMTTKTIRVAHHVKKVAVYKSNFSYVVHKVKFHQLLGDLLKGFCKLVGIKIEVYVEDLIFNMRIVQGAALQCVDPAFVPISLNSSLIPWRKQLPIWKHRKRLITKIISNQVNIISGGPGIGKSTQIPQYIMEYMSGCRKDSRIICVCPYRTVAMAMAKRIALERGEVVGKNVGYRTVYRMEHRSNTPAIFTTSEILLRTMIDSDRFFNTTTHVVIDNVDVRDKYTDVVLLCIRECLKSFPKFRLILISGSTDNELFVNYFKGASVVNIPSPNIDVNSLDVYYLKDLYKITGHTPRLQELVRVLPDSEQLDRLKEFFYEDPRHFSVDLELVCKLLHFICEDRPMGAILVYLPSYEDIIELQNLFIAHSVDLPFHYDIFILHRMIDNTDQNNIFLKSKRRKIILASAFVEFTYFIDDVFYVIDAGINREAQFVAGNFVSNVTMFWISKAAAIRRSTRMGYNENGPVECYRLYTKEEHKTIFGLDIAEIRRAPLTDLCLICRKIITCEILMHEFFNLCIEPPLKSAVIASMNYLMQIGAFHANGSLSAWGNIMWQMPLEPRLTKMLMYGLAFNCIQPIVTIVTFLALRGPCVLPALPENQPFLANVLRQYSCGGYSDHLSLLNCYEVWSDILPEEEKKQFCTNHFIRAGFMDLVIVKRNEVLMHLFCLGYLTILPIFGVEERNCYGKIWFQIKACITAGLAPHYAYVCRDKLKLRTSTHDNLDITFHSVCHREIKNLPTDWLIYETTDTLNEVNNITCVNPFTMIVFGSNCQWELKDYDASFKPYKHPSYLFLNQWAQFTDKRAVLKVFIGLKQRLNEYMQFFITLPRLTPGSDAEKTFSIIHHALGVEDAMLQLNLGTILPLTKIQKKYSVKPYNVTENDEDDSSDESLSSIEIDSGSDLFGQETDVMETIEEEPDNAEVDKEKGDDAKAVEVKEEVKVEEVEY